MRNQYDNKDCLEMGLTAEQSFVIAANKKQFSCTESTKEENINSHIDFWIHRDDKSYSVDVKAAKRIQRSDKDVNYEKIWVELHSVREDNKGWLLDGKADFIAFEQQDHFIVANRMWLISFIREAVTNVKVKSPSDALYALYTREGRPDILTLINAKDILDISTIWLK
jgi:hypothetical protein